MDCWIRDLKFLRFRERITSIELEVGSSCWSSFAFCQIQLLLSSSSCVLRISNKLAIPTWMNLAWIADPTEFYSWRSRGWNFLETISSFACSSVSPLSSHSLDPSSRIPFSFFFPNSPLLNLVPSLQLRDRDEDDDSLLSTLDIDFLCSRELQRSQFRLQFSHAGFQIQDGLTDHGLGLGWGRSWSVCCSVDLGRHLDEEDDEKEGREERRGERATPRAFTYTSKLFEIHSDSINMNDQSSKNGKLNQRIISASTCGGEVHCCGSFKIGASGSKSQRLKTIKV